MNSVANEAVDAVPGFFNHGAAILDLLEVHRPMVVVELGTWLGASAIGMCRSVRRWGGTVTCVDTWCGTMAAETNATYTPLMLLSCARNIVDAGLGASIRLCPATTRDAGRAWVTRNIDCLYIDADHSYDAVAEDLATWAPLVKPGGLIMGDDYGHRMFPGVAEAWDEFAARNARTFARYQSDPPHPDGIQLIFGTI